MRIPPFCLLLALGACCSDPVDGSKYLCFGSMSLAEEQQLGDSYAPTIDVMYDGVYPDADADAYLGALVREMAGHSVRADDFTWKFTILNTSVPNAFAVPGGYVYVTRGLLAALETEGQFVSVMGHELGHVEHRHTHMAMGRQTVGGVLVGLIGAVEGALTETGQPGLGTTLGEAGTTLVLLRYGRDQELEADARGIHYATAMGYDPLEAVKTFEYFESLEAAAGGTGFSWLRTHPLNEDRIADIRRLVAERHPEVLDRPKSSFRPYREGNRRFDEIVARIRERQPVYDAYDAARAELDAARAAGKPSAEVVERAARTFAECARALPDDPLFPAALGEAELLRGDLGAAEKALRKAIQLDDAYLPERRLFAPRHSLGVVAAARGQHAAAVEAFLAASEAFPMHPEPHFQRGRSLEALGRKDDARLAYERVLQLEQGAPTTLSEQAAARLEALGR